MRPRQFSRGNRELEQRRVFVVRASMRPRQFSRGNGLAAWRTARELLGRFNEAAAIQPRKHETALRMTGGRYRFNEAAAIQPRKPATAGRTQSPHRPSFNEAAAIQPRKHRHLWEAAMRAVRLQ